MSNRQNVAEHGVGLCVAILAGVGLTGAALVAPLASLGVLAAWGIDRYKSCSKRKVRGAVQAAAKALEKSGATERGMTAALTLLKDRKGQIKITPYDLAERDKRLGFPDALYDMVFAGAEVPKDDGVERILRKIITAAFEKIRLEDDFDKIFVQESVTALEHDVASGFKRIEDLLTNIKDDTSAIRGMAEELVAREESRAQEFGIKEGMLIALARRYAEGNPEDFDAALRGLERALEVAANEKQRGALPGNTDDAVNAVIEKVDALNADGEIDEAAALIAEEEARAEAGLIRLYDKGIAQAILTRDVAAACAYEMKKLPLDVPNPAAQFEALRAVRRVWYERGRDKGLNFDLEVSIALARASFDRAKNEDERGTAGNDLGNALAILGERETGTEKLDEAVKAYRAALKEYTRELVPLDWAMTQMNLGNALSNLGDRETGTEKLYPAVEAYRAALKEYTRARVPLDWAMTQMNLGTALSTLGEREPGTEKLYEAVEAYRAALKEYTRARAPLHWAMTQMNLGTTLSTLGQREPGTEKFYEAVEAYREALKENTRERAPLEWAKSQTNLGNALATLGQLEPGTEKLYEAVKAYREALKERTRERVPLHWAYTWGNQGSALMVLAERKWDAENARQALDQLTEAGSVLREGGHFAWAKTFEDVIPEAQALVDKLTSDTKA